MVGADPSPVARRVASARLAAAGVPHVIMDGDIADPARLARELAAAGLDAGDALHVCKSAIHDRAYRPPAPSSAPPAVRRRQAPPDSGPPDSAPSAPPGAMTAYAQPDGSAIPASAAGPGPGRAVPALAAAGRPARLAGDRGALGPAATAAGLIGRTLATALDATHGYSCQYPVEPEVFAWAARAGGFISRAHAEPGASALGHTLLTIDHFVADGS